MTIAQIRTQRLLNHQISATHMHKPHDVVQWLGAMQAQEYAMVKWAIGMRLPKATDALVEKAFNAGAILRTHILRPTWHFVLPYDIRWIIQLSAPRVHAVNKYYYKKFELSDAVLKKSRAVLEKTLRDGNHCTRDTLKATLDEHKIRTEGLQLAYLLMHAELEGLIGSGPREGKQFTYALLDERIDPVKPVSREEALAMLMLRYISSRGPVMLQDFTYWSGLTAKDARDGLASIEKQVENIDVEGNTYFFTKPIRTGKTVAAPTTFLMADYDEYGMSYKNRSALVDPKSKHAYNAATDYQHMLVVDGVIAGTWKHFKRNNSVEVDVRPFRPFTKTEKEQVDKAIKRYQQFVIDSPDHDEASPKRQEKKR